MSRRHIVVISDLHVGSVVGLWPRDGAPVEGGGLYLPNKPQAWLASCWSDMLERVAALRPKPVIVLNGDAIQGVHERDGQIVGATVEAQVDAAYMLLKPLADMASGFYVVRGTEYHDGKTGQDVEGLAKRLCARENDSARQASAWELYLRCNEKILHFAHHIGATGLALYEATVPLRNALLQILELEREYGGDAPRVDVMIRSHRHRYVYVATDQLQVVTTPCWQLMTAHQYRRGATSFPHIGWLLITVEGGDAVIRPRIYKPPVLNAVVEV